MLQSKYFVGLFFLLLCIHPIANGTEQSHKDESGKLLWQLDFSRLADIGPEETIRYIESLDIKFGIDADEITLEIKKGQLTLTTRERSKVFFGIRFYGEKLHHAELAVIDWGVNRFAEDANWEKGNNRVAIAAMFALGSETFSSGLPFGINAAPYFLAPFIGEKETVDKLYKGRLYQKAGRYVCIANKEGAIQTRFEIGKIFRGEFGQSYKKPGTPPVTGIGFQMNTENTHGGASAFIRSIRLYEK